MTRVRDGKREDFSSEVVTDITTVVQNLANMGIEWQRGKEVMASSNGKGQ